MVTLSIKTDQTIYEEEGYAFEAPSQSVIDAINVALETVSDDPRIMVTLQARCDSEGGALLTWYGSSGERIILHWYDDNEVTIRVYHDGDVDMGVVDGTGKNPETVASTYKEIIQDQLEGCIWIIEGNGQQVPLSSWWMQDNFVVAKLSD